MTKLPGGRVLIAGGRAAPNGVQINSSAEIYDPVAQTFTPTGSLNLERYNHSAILLDDGRVLLVGGWIQSFVTATNTAEVYDPSTGTFSFVGNMTITRSEQPALHKRPDGTVLVIGGSFEGGFATATDKIDLFDPTTNQFSAFGTLSLSRHGHAVCPLPSGELLVAGGTYSCCNAAQTSLRLTSAELLDPTVGTSVSIAATMNYPHRTSALGVALDDGRCLISGNEGSPRGLDAYDPATGLFSDFGPTIYITRATKLLNGQVLLSGKGGPPGLFVFDPDTNLNQSTGFSVLSDHSAVLLNDGTVLISGGYDGVGERSDAFIYSAGPQADAGPDQTENEGILVTLDGGGSTGVANYSWSQIAGGPVILSDPTSANPTFVTPYISANTTLTFELVVDDGAGTSSDPDTVDITVVDVNSPPVADAGNDGTIKEGAIATLDGSLSFDPEGDTPLGYTWTQTGGPLVTLQPSDTVVNPTFTAPLGVGNVVKFELVVDDGKEESNADSVSITVVENTAPEADAGPDQTVDEGTLVNLDGTNSSDADGGDTLSFDWSEPLALDDDTSATPSFTAPLASPGGFDLDFDLVVTDDDPVNPKSSAPDQVTLHVRNVNDPPSCDLAKASCPGSKIKNNDGCTLWPPNHKLIDVTIEGVTDGDATYNDVTLTITGVTQDEPGSGTGEGDSSPDAVVQDGGQVDSVLIRAERQGGGNGRVYRVDFTADDGFESCTGSITVGVPHDRKDTPIDDGQTYDSTMP